MSNELTLTFFADAGHAWLEVPKQLIKLWDLESRISNFSYELKNNVYLEEDCDAPLFMEVAKTKGLRLNIEEVDTDYSSIRNYPQYVVKH